jgi:hypothetical protein
MKKSIFIILLIFVSLLFTSCTDITGDKAEITDTAGNTQTVYKVTVSDNSVSYYKTKEDSKKEDNKVVIPLSSVKTIAYLKEEESK